MCSEGASVLIWQCVTIRPESPTGSVLFFFCLSSGCLSLDSRRQNSQNVISEPSSASPADEKQRSAGLLGISILELLIIFHHWFFFPPLLAHSSSLLYYPEASSRACVEFNKAGCVCVVFFILFYETVSSVQGFIQILIFHIINNRTAFRILSVPACKEDNKWRQKAEGSSAESTPSAATSAVAHVSRTICFGKLIFTGRLGSLIALASMWKLRLRSPSANVGLIHL